eukprot:1173651-Prymnesium_polylepis.1
MDTRTRRGVSGIACWTHFGQPGGCDRLGVASQCVVSAGWGPRRMPRRNQKTKGLHVGRKRARRCACGQLRPCDVGSPKAALLGVLLSGRSEELRESGWCWIEGVASGWMAVERRVTRVVPPYTLI